VGPEGIPESAVVQHLLESPMFDVEWYKSISGLSSSTDWQAAAHFYDQGALEGLSPSRLFDCRAYLAQNPDVKESGVNPLWHFEVRGADEGRLAQSVKGSVAVWASGGSTVGADGSLESRLERRRVLIGQIQEALAESQLVADLEIELLRESPLMDSEWYLRRYLDVNTTRQDPVQHYVKYGALEGRDPGPFFDSSVAKLLVADTGVTPLTAHLVGTSDQTASICALSSFERFLQMRDGTVPSEWTDLEQYAFLQYEPLDVGPECEEVECIKAIIGRSPFMTGEPPHQYLARFRKNMSHGGQFQTLQEFLDRSLVEPVQVRGLAETDIRILSVLGSRKECSARSNPSCSEHSVTIVMPTQDRPAALKRAVGSVLAQTHGNWRLIVVNDGGESPGEWLERLGDSRIELVESQCRRGAAHARNRALDRIDGEFVAYLDDDNMWEPEFLRASISLLVSSDADITYSGQMLWSGFDDKTGLGYEFLGYRFAVFNRALLENTNFIDLNCLVHRSTLLTNADRFDESLARLMDWDWVLRLSEHGTVVGNPECHVHYFASRETQSISNTESYEEARFQVLERLNGRAKWRRRFFGIDGKSRMAWSLPRPAGSWNGSNDKAKEGKFHAIVPAFGRPAITLQCLEALLEGTPELGSLIVVDDGNPQEEWLELNRAVSELPHLQLVRNTKGPHGFTHAVNLGLKHVNHRELPVAIVNNDAIVTPGWAGPMLDALVSQRDLAVAVPREVVWLPNATADKHVPGADMNSREVDVTISRHHNNLYEWFGYDKVVSATLSYAPAFCITMSADFLNALSWRLDSHHGPHYRSDRLLAESAALLGLKYGYVGSSKVYHLQGVATQERGRIWI